MQGPKGQFLNQSYDGMLQMQPNSYGQVLHTSDDVPNTGGSKKNSSKSTAVMNPQLAQGMMIANQAQYQKKMMMKNSN